MPAIVKLKSDTTPAIKPELPTIEPTSYRSIVNDDTRVPSASLLAYVEGMPWTCTYYQQVVSKHNDLREIDPGQAAIYQQYHRINNLELRVDGDLSTTHNTETGTTEVTGSAFLYGYLVPNVMDYFTADTGSYRTALYRITAIDRRTYQKQSVFSLEYSLVGYIDDDQLTIYQSLITKVIREYYFDKDRLVETGQPVLKSEDYHLYKDLQLQYRHIVKHYFQTFFNRKYMTLVLPGQDYAIYDIFLVDYLLKIVESDDAPEIRLVKHLSTDHDPYLRQPQFWQALLERDISVLKYCNLYMNVAHRYSFNGNAFIHGLAYSNIDYFIYPSIADVSTVSEHNPLPKPVSLIDLVDTTDALGQIGDMFRGRYIDAHASYVIASKILDAKTYVLSENFYGVSTAPLTLLEVLVKDYLKHQAIDQTLLSVLCEKYKEWNRLEQFYYGPVLLTLIRTSRREVYT